MVCQHRGGFRIQFGILFLPLISRITASVVRWRGVWLAEEAAAVKIASWLSASSSPKPIAA